MHFRAYVLILNALQTHASGQARPQVFNYYLSENKNGIDMEYGVFKVNENNLLELQVQYKIKADALAHIRVGGNMVLLEIYL